ncbi:Multidrug transporter AcrB [Candidatus Filomicrobium marinum]|uniref:Multidrug transporter AcrB n=1 Tax=Candidatus Filomicrobium marinum TaxID=1608628 RepID=A0A0D6JIZ4_9HYPH|nr:efflux RND transporter permease subunit [Candidatus Filomicrobium marinum]CFX33331.1 Multidrug transporter AcrB [Candidatus Filomicrobium marinum]CPR21923.1 Multidrug transporter AcrB [Candidatus Filomicrobium marinum]
MTAAPEGSQSSSKPDDGGWVGVFIRRPILALVVNLLIIIAGVAALQSIEIRELPDVDRPVVTVRASYPGATPESMDAQITAIIESAVSRVQGITGISSTSSYGSSRVSIEFSSETNMETAAMDVRDAVAGITNQLPDDMDEEPRVIKADSDASPIIRIAVSSTTLSESELTDYVENIIEDRLAAVEGVAAANSYGLRAKTIEVRASLVALAGRGLSLQDLIAAINKASVVTPSGALENETQQLLVRAEAPVMSPTDVSALEINSHTKVGDVAFVRWAFQEATAVTRLNGETAIGMEIIRQAQANTIRISDGVRAAVEELRKSLPEGVTIAITSDDATFIRESISEVFISLLLATAIVILIIFAFLQSVRATVAPALAIPVSLIGTLAAIWMAGFSINLLTLLALVVATGLVVDDAIVVLENIARRRAMGAGPRAAAVLGTKEIVFAVLSTTATLAAVFVPISFMPGIVGNLFSEFGFVLAFAVTISSAVALILCPMLASKLGTGVSISDGETRKGLLGGMGALGAAAYGAILNLCLKLRYLFIALCLGFAALGWLAYENLPKEITPTEDRGVVLIRLGTQQGSNLQYSAQKTERVEAVLHELKDRGEVTDVLAMIGRGGVNRAFVIAPLAPWSERSRSQQEIQAELQRRFASIPGITVSLLSPNSLGIRGGGQGLRFAVAGPNYDRLADVALKIANKLSETPGFRNARTDYDTTQPQLSVRINREAATTLGVSIDTITSLINTMVDYGKAADLFIDDEIVEVQVKAGGRPINDPSDLENLFVKASDGSFITLSSLVTMEEVAIAPSLSREDRQRSVPITASLNQDVVLGDAVTTMRTVAAPLMDPNMSIILLGEARTLSETSENTALVFSIALIIVFLVLAAQFESIVSALVILLTVPFGLAAAVFAIQLTGGTLNVYSQIGLVLLVGVMAKNGILIVEFANQRRDEGADVDTAIRDAATTRLRPVMMTMASTVLGALPLIFATGAGAESRLALGWVIIGGLGFATIFTLFLTPITFRILAPFSKPRADETRLLVEELKSAPQ